MNSDLLKQLLSKGKGMAEKIMPKFRSAKAFEDEVTGQAFNTGRKGPWGQTAGGARANFEGDGNFVGSDGLTGGPIAMDLQKMRPLNEWDMIKRKLAMLTPEQKAALMAGTAGLGAGGIGGYMAGDSVE